MKRVLAGIFLVAIAASAQTSQQPRITSIRPQAWTSGGRGFDLTVVGTFPDEGSEVAWNGARLPTRFVRIGEVSATVSASMVANAGRAAITVVVSGSYIPGVGFSPDLISPPVDFLVNAAPSITTAVLPAGVAGAAYSAQLAATGGTSPYRWSSTGLPTGLSIDAATGAITGAVSAAGVFDIAVALTDAAGVMVSRTLPLSIAPAITSLAPASTSAGGPQFTLTINGAGFGPQSVARWNQATLATMVVSFTQLTAIVPAALIVNPGAIAVTVASGGVTSAPASFAVGNPPSISALSPSTAAAGSESLTMTVTGTGFADGATVMWNNTTLPATLVSATQLTATIGASLLASQGTASIIVVNPGGLRSNAASFTITPPAPVITSLDPASAMAGGPAFILTVNGRNFVSQSVVQWNNTALATTFGSATRLTAAVPAALLDTAAGVARISVMNPGAVVSPGVDFVISAPPAPVISSLNPGSTVAGGSALTVGVTGANFVAGSVVYWNETALGTTFTSVTQLSAAVPASLLAAPGTAGISVLNPRNVRSGITPFRITLPAAPGATITGVGDTANAAEQPRFELALNSPYPFSISGRLDLAFTPESGADDPAIQFSTGGRSASFTIAANATRATFSTADIALQTGTVAGTIVLTTTLQAAGQTLAAPPPRSIRVGRAAPAIRSVRIENRTANGFSVAVTGFSTPREVTQAVFRFTASGRGSLQTTEVQSAMTALFSTWYQAAASTPFGSQFTLVQPFTIQQGDIGAISSVSVTLVNSVGSSQAASATF